MTVAALDPSLGDRPDDPQRVPGVVGPPAPGSDAVIRTDPRPDAEVVAAAQTALLDRDSLEARLAEAEETLRAIRAGEVDAIVVADAVSGERVFTWSGADRPYRIFVENMRDGAATVSEDGFVLYANQRLADLLCLPVSRIVGVPFTSFIPELSRRRFGTEIAEAGEGHNVEMDVRRDDGVTVPTLLGLFQLDVETDHMTCITITDLTAQKAQEQEIRRLAKAQGEHLIDLQAAVRALTEQATHDALTGLPNRDLLVDRLEQALIRAQRTRTCTGVMFVDLDHFKRINDSLGHTAGDTVLWHVAAALRHAVRSMDTVARLGGDEFVVLCPDLHRPAEAVDISRRIVADLGRIGESWAQAAGLTASVGVSVVRDGAATAEDMLHEADTAMYRAKSLGRNRTQFSPTAPAPRVPGRAKRR